MTLDGDAATSAVELQMSPIARPSQIGNTTARPRSTLYVCQKMWAEKAISEMVDYLERFPGLAPKPPTDVNLESWGHHRAHEHPYFWAGFIYACSRSDGLNVPLVARGEVSRTVGDA